MNFSEAINATIANNLPTITGRYYFDSVKKGLYQITDSVHYFTELDYAFGNIWPVKRHLILASRKANKREYERFMNCGNKEYKDLAI